MTNQEAFDRAVRGLRSQGYKRSLDPATEDSFSGPACAYNSPDGRHCAVGWLISDIALPPEMNIKRIAILRQCVPAVAERLGGLDADFIRALQVAHDTGYRSSNFGGYDAPPIDDSKRMVDNLRQVAFDFGLWTTELDVATEVAGGSVQ